MRVQIYMHANLLDSRRQTKALPISAFRCLSNLSCRILLWLKFCIFCYDGVHLVAAI